MLIRDIIKENVPATAAEPQAPAGETAPPPEEIKAVQDLLGTIDPQREQPQTLLNKLTSWMRAHPLLDKVTDIIPQTRLVKAIAAAADAIEAGDNRAALASLAGGLTGNVGKALQQANTLVNVGSNLAQGNVQGAALAAGGNVATVAKGAMAANTLAQGGTVAQAAQQLGGTAAKVARGAEFVQNKLAPATVPQPATAVAQAPQQTDTDAELARIKQLAEYRLAIIETQGQFDAGNLAVIKSLINPQAQANFARLAQTDPVHKQVSGSRKRQLLQGVRDLAQWEDPLSIIQYALNVGNTPEEVLAAMPKDMDLGTAPKLGTMSQQNLDLLKR